MEPLSIPEVIGFEIISWLPVKSLMRFKSVSKFCNSLVSESVFVDIHQCHSSGSEIKFIVRQNSELYTVETIEAMEEGKVSPLHIDNFCEKLLYDPIGWCVNGLFCCSIDHIDRVVICNPSTKVVRSLPGLKNEYLENFYARCYSYSMGFDPEEKTYKVLMTFNGHKKLEIPTRNWVFTLGIDESWREIKSNTNFTLPFNKKNPVCVSGVIYMMSYIEGKLFVIAFDVKSEKFRVIRLWNSIDEHMIVGSYYNMLKVNGKLAILNEKLLFFVDHMDLWILGKEEWEEHFIQIQIPPQQWTRPERPTFCGTSDGEILFTKRSGSCKLICFCYNVTEKTWKFFKIEGLSKNSWINAIYSYDERLFPVERICNSA